jgi:hypothetical protein
MQSQEPIKTQIPDDNQLKQLNKCQNQLIFDSNFLKNLKSMRAPPENVIAL